MVNKTISDLEPIIEINTGDKLLAIEDGVGTFNCTVDDVKDYILKSAASSRIIISNNGIDSNNDIDSSVGNFQFSDDSGQVRSNSIFTKRLDASWTAGTNQGGLFSGSKANTTWYDYFGIYDPINKLIDFGFDISPIAANRPVAYTKYKLLGSVLTNSSGNILQFTQIDKYFWLKDKILNLNITTTAGSRTNFVVTAPVGRVTIAIVRAGLGHGTADDLSINLLSPDDNNLIPLSGTGYDADLAADETYAGSIEKQIKTNLLSQISYTPSRADSCAFSVRTVAYIDINL